jgi:hypothetical protein
LLPLGFLKLDLGIHSLKDNTVRSILTISEIYFGVAHIHCWLIKSFVAAFARA